MTHSPPLGHEPAYQGLPFEEFSFLDEGEQAVKFTVEDNEFILQLDTYAVTQAPVSSRQEQRRRPGIAREDVYGGANVMEIPSPDGRWFAGLQEHNLWLRSTEGSESVQLTTDGIKREEWDVAYAVWSPDSRKLATTKVNYREKPGVPVVHWLSDPVEVQWVHHAIEVWGGGPGTEVFVVDVPSRQKVRIRAREDPGQSLHIIGWLPDGSELLLLRKDLDSKKLDLLAADPETGAARLVLTEERETFVIDWSFYAFRLLRRFTLLERGKRFLWLSERDGWNHLYLYGIDGTLIRRLTEGDFPVVRIEAVNEEERWVYFTAHGDRERPYDIHLYRVNLEGEGFTRLTEGIGQHEIQFSPSKQFFLDIHSSVDRPAVVELRRADGTLLQTLAKANIDALVMELKWGPPEEFVVKAADGKTDLYGVLFKPYDFDPSRTYPIVEVIYAGPQRTAVPHTFSPTFSGLFAQAFAQLGFITFVVDARGTPERGKAFQDVVYGNFGRHEIPDHVAALKQLAEDRPYMDLGRVGIFGYSFGGYFAVRAMLLAPDVYHVGVAGGGRQNFDTSYFLGPLGENSETREHASNLRLADNLRGKLLLLHGTGDVNSPLAQTMQLVDAFIQVGKPYDLLLFPEEHHLFLLRPGKARSYFRDAVSRYFREHLKP